MKRDSSPFCFSCVLKENHSSLSLGHPKTVRIISAQLSTELLHQQNNFSWALKYTNSFLVFSFIFLMPVMRWISYASFSFIFHWPVKSTWQVQYFSNHYQFCLLCLIFKHSFVVFFQALPNFPFLEVDQGKNKFLIIFLYEKFEIYLTFEKHIFRKI